MKNLSGFNFFIERFSVGRKLDNSLRS